MTTQKEAIYDEQITPLMAQISAICATHKIAFVADFALGYDNEDESQLRCTTVQLRQDRDPTSDQICAARILYGKTQ